MDISIIIPALNEERKIRYDIETAARFIASTFSSGEVIVVDDGSTDRTAETALAAKIPANVNLKVHRMGKNCGKGAAVKAGVAAARGRIILYADSGTCIPYANALPSIKQILAGEIDIAIASRRHKKSAIRRNRPLARRILSRIFHCVSLWITDLPRWISDSQCGFKIYDLDAAKDLFSACRTSGFMFEIEILIRAQKKEMRIEEFPVEWSCDLDTRLHPRSEALSVIKELLQVRSITKKTC